MDGFTALGILLFVVWLSQGLFAGWLAQEKGRPVGRWFTLGVLFGPLAVVTVGLAPRGYSGFKPCVECQEPIDLAATRCPYCTTDLIEAEDEEGES